MTTQQYQRFPIWRRIEHVVMLLSFTLLALTGLPQKFPQAGGSIFIVDVLGGIENLRRIHHAAAIVMMLGAIWHLAVFGYLAYVRHTRLSMIPSLQDVKDGIQATLYNLGFARRFPQMGRYTFEEKMEYWAFVWGTAIMVITGFMMWNPLSTIKFLPGEFIPAAKSAHGGEAALAVLAIIVWHMYGVHIKRFNKSMFTGQMSEQDMLHEHPLELADIKAGIAERPIDPVAVAKRQRVYLPVAAIVSIALLTGVYEFVNAEQTALTTTERQYPTIEVYVPFTATPAPTQTQTPPPSDLKPTPFPPGFILTWDNSIGAIFEAKCALCHDAGAAAGLNITTYADAMKGGESGVAIVAGDGTNSPLVIKQQGKHPKQFTADELKTIIEWINAGALEK